MHRGAATKCAPAARSALRAAPAPGAAAILVATHFSVPGRFAMPAWGRSLAERRVFVVLGAVLVAACGTPSRPVPAPVVEARPVPAAVPTPVPTPVPTRPLPA